MEKTLRPNQRHLLVFFGLLLAADDSEPLSLSLQNLRPIRIESHLKRLTRISPTPFSPYYSILFHIFLWLRCVSFSSTLSPQPYLCRKSVWVLMKLMNWNSDYFSNSCEQLSYMCISYTPSTFVDISLVESEYSWVDFEEIAFFFRKQQQTETRTQQQRIYPLSCTIPFSKVLMNWLELRF